jgi:hypothetical protein
MHIYIIISCILVDILPRSIQEDPIIIHPESSILRQQILQELRDRLDTQLIELKKEYGIEPTKGKQLISFARFYLFY